MPTIMKHTIEWSSFPGAPGFTTMWSEPGLDFTASIKDFFEAIKGYIPSGTKLTYPAAPDMIDVASGALTGTGDPTGLTQTTCVSTGAYAAGMGACVNWITADFGAHGRRKGRTFIVPLTKDAFETNGTLLDTFYTVLTAASQALWTDHEDGMLVYHRPVNGVGGSKHVVTGYTLKDRSAILRTRRA